jgi:polysaccharide export outer membrane protein
MLLLSYCSCDGNLVMAKELQSSFALRHRSVASRAFFPIGDSMRRTANTKHRFSQFSRAVVYGAFSLVGVLCVCGATRLNAQQSPQQSNQRNSDMNASGGNLPMQKIGSDDLVSVQVYDSPELTRTVRVGRDGELRMPLLTKPIEAAGLLPSELEQRIGDELKKEGILVRPIVSVSIAEYRSRPISVVGSVKHPLTFQAFGNVTLLDAITRAEGLSDSAGSEILVTHPGTPGSGTGAGSSLVQRIPVKALLDGSNESLNIKLDGGEEVRVPEGGRVYVVGNVKKPGAIPVHELSELTVLRVLSQAEGLSPYAAKDAFILRHGDTPNTEIPIHLEKIMERKSPDVALMPNDVLFVPDSKGKRTTGKLLEAVTTFGIGAASGLLIWH